MTAEGLVLYSGTVIQAGSFQERLDAAAAGGFTAVSMFPHDYLGARAAGLGDEDMRQRLAAAGTTVAAVDPVTTWLPGSAPPPGTSAELLAFAQHSVEEVVGMAVALGAAGINALEFWGVPVEVDTAAAAFGRLCDAAAEHGLRVHLEAMPFSGIPDVATAWAIVEGADRPNGGLLLDSWHWFRGDNSIDLLARIPADRIFAVQLADGPTTPAEDLPTESMQARMLPGTGDWPVAAWLRAVHSTGARPSIGPEVFSATLAAAPTTEVGRRAGDATRAVVAAAADPGPS